MQTIEGLKRRIRSTEDLHSVVRTMKALAAVNIRQFQKASEAVEEYSRTVDLGLGMVLRLRPDFLRHLEREEPAGRTAAVLFGSDQGMCGQLNNQVVSHAARSLAERGITPEEVTALIMGERITGLAEDQGFIIREYFGVPGSVGAITPLARDMLPTIESWRERGGIARVELFYSRPSSRSGSEPVSSELLPLDMGRLKALRKNLSRHRGLPMFRMEFRPLFSSLIRQHLFFSLYRAVADSLASENAMRLASMQGAEKNIEERLGELEHTFHRTRQMSITEELLDIVSGFEALGKDEEDRDAA
jgi:F-type H+-transporting ATPase subunit gamma